MEVAHQSQHSSPGGEGRCHCSPALSVNIYHHQIKDDVSKGGTQDRGHVASISREGKLHSSPPSAVCEPGLSKHSSEHPL